MGKHSNKSRNRTADKTEQFDVKDLKIYVKKLGDSEAQLVSAQEFLKGINPKLIWAEKPVFKNADLQQKVAQVKLSSDCVMPTLRYKPQQTAEQVELRELTNGVGHGLFVRGKALWSGTLFSYPGIIDCDSEESSKDLTYCLKYMFINGQEINFDANNYRGFATFINHAPTEDELKSDFYLKKGSPKPLAANAVLKFKFASEEKMLYGVIETCKVIQDGGQILFPYSTIKNNMNYWQNGQVERLFDANNELISLNNYLRLNFIFPLMAKELNGPAKISESIEREGISLLFNLSKMIVSLNNNKPIVADLNLGGNEFHYTIEHNTIIRGVLQHLINHLNNILKFEGLESANKFLNETLLEYYSHVTHQKYYADWFQEKIITELWKIIPKNTQSSSPADVAVDESSKELGKSDKSVAPYSQTTQMWKSTSASLENKVENDKEEIKAGKTEVQNTELFSTSIQLSSS